MKLNMQAACSDLKIWGNKGERKTPKLIKGLFPGS